MNKNKFIHPVKPYYIPVVEPRPVFKDKYALENYFRKKGLKIKLGKTLKGGIVSQVYDASFANQKVVVKHTEDFSPKEPTMFFESRQGHNLDTKILEKLSKTDVRVPRVLKHFAEVTTTVMEDVREGDFFLLSDVILEKRLKLNSAEKIGSALGKLIKMSRNWSSFFTTESAEQCIYERSLELRMLFPNNKEFCEEINREFIKRNKFWNWPDGDPKNIFVDSKGNCCFIDFGRSNFSDHRYMLPNFLAHIILYSIAGYISLSLVKDYFKACIKGYLIYQEIDEKMFCKYLGMEILYRSCGKWIRGIETADQKIKVLKFGMSIFEKRLFRMKGLMAVL